MHYHCVRNMLLCCVSGLAISGVLTPVMAAPENEGAKFMIEEIIVTALKREQALQKVPVSIQALTKEKLENLGADTFTDYARTIANLSFVDRGPNRNEIILRGLSPLAGVSTVGLNIDGVAVQSGANNPDLKLFDIERIEVLRGPQGTLYGEGSMGGTINVITEKPRLDSFEAKLEGTLSTTHKGGENFSINGMVNAPIVENKFAIRAVGYYRNEDGWIDNVQLNRNNVNDEETVGGRISAKLSASDNLDIILTAHYQNMELVDGI